MSADNEQSSRESITSETESSKEDVILSVQNSSVSFDMERGESRVLDEVSFNIHRHEIIGIVGESGSGKSMFADSLLDAIVDPGVLQGNITYFHGDGRSTNILELNEEELRQFRWEEVSMVFQGAMSSFNPTMKLNEHFRETLEAHDSNIQDGMDHARELLSELYLQPERVLQSYPHELSGGMKQRVLIALSLVLEPKMLVMDEPTAALDLLMQRSILSLLQNLQERYELTVVFITHDLPLVADLADRLAVMYAFDIVEYGATEELITDPAHPYTRALLRAVPNLSSPLSEMQPIEGSSPDPVNVPSGCSYHPRCPLADEQCTSGDPPFYEIDDAATPEGSDMRHEAKCFYWEEARDTLSLEKEKNISSTYSGGEQSEEPIIQLSDLDIHFEQQNEGLIKSIFGEPDTVHAVDDVDLDIYDNDVVALVGESGCGKTTLGKAAIGVQRPTNGTVTYHGQDLWQTKDNSRSNEIPYEDIRRALQIIHQDPGSSLNPNRTVRATLSVPLKRWFPDLTTEERQTQIFNTLAYVGMTPPEDYAQRYPHQLSGGEKQRVALVRALLMNPDLIFADEAVSALDVSLRVEMMDLMLKLQDIVNTSFLFISHDLANARYLAGKSGGRIGVMYLGEIVEIGPAEDIIDDPQHPYTKVLMWSTADLDTNRNAEDPSIRRIDIPDPIDPPSGCRFHTRCPEARETCREQVPELDSETEHKTACFRTCDSDHDYWESEPIDEVDTDS